MADTKIGDASSGAPVQLTDTIPIGRSPGPSNVMASGLLARNLLINGNFVINQRAYVSAAVLAAGTYGHDRWKAGASGGDYSFTQLQNSTTITIASGKSLIQVVEDKNVEGGSYVLSWSGSAQARVGVNSATPSGSYAASPVSISSQAAGTVMSVEFNNGSLTNVMLAPGTEAAPFQRVDYVAELMKCYRYYYRRTPLAANDVFGVGFVIAGTTAYINTRFPVKMRSAPSALEQSGTAADYGVQHSATSTVCSAVPTFQSRSSDEEAVTALTVAAGLTVGHGCTGYAAATTGYLAWSTEF